MEGRNADVILAAYKGIQAAYRLLKAGGTNTSVFLNIELFRSLKPFQKSLLRMDAPPLKEYYLTT